MLKRQRAISPPSLDVPFITPDAIDMSSHHPVKRRRVVAPVLDGEKRGWRAEMDNELEDKYSYEDDDSEGREIAGEGQEEDFGAAETYKSTNSILHDLHALYRHRMRMSPNSTSMPTSLQPYPASLSSSLNHPLYKFSHHTAAKSILQPISDHPPGLGPFEVQRVKERYEDTNRYVSKPLFHFLSLSPVLKSTGIVGTLAAKGSADYPLTKGNCRNSIYVPLLIK